MRKATVKLLRAVAVRRFDALDRRQRRQLSFRAMLKRCRRMWNETPRPQRHALRRSLERWVDGH